MKPGNPFRVHSHFAVSNGSLTVLLPFFLVRPEFDGLCGRVRHAEITHVNNVPPGTPDTMATTGHLRGVSARFAKLPPSDVAPDACRTKGRTAGRCHRGVLPGGLGDARGSSEEAVLEICENEKSLDCECVSLGSDKRFFEVFQGFELGLKIVI